MYCLILAPPRLRHRPQDLVVEQGRDAEFECGGEGNPRPLLFWTVEGNRSLLLPGVKNDRFFVSPSLDGRITLTIKVRV